LSFAQFEREVTSERIRDKIAASKKKGLWMGGTVPLGYESRTKKLVIVPEEAEQVRLIFRRYLDLGSLDGLMRDLRERGIRTKVRRLSNGRVIGGIALTLSVGEHEPIVGRALFEAVQAKLASQSRCSGRRQTASGALLKGKLFDRTAIA
jgi:site-specific DNA recombinase